MTAGVDTCPRACPLPRPLLSFLFLLGLSPSMIERSHGASHRAPLSRRERRGAGSGRGGGRRVARSPWVASAGLCAPTAVASAVRGRHGPGWRGPRPRPAPGHPWVSPEVCRKCSRQGAPSAPFSAGRAAAPPPGRAVAPCLLPVRRGRSKSPREACFHTMSPALRSVNIFFFSVKGTHKHAK